MHKQLHVLYRLHLIYGKDSEKHVKTPMETLKSVSEHEFKLIWKKFQFCVTRIKILGTKIEMELFKLKQKILKNFFLRKQ